MCRYVHHPCTLDRPLRSYLKFKQLSFLFMFWYVTVNLVRVLYNHYINLSIVSFLTRHAVFCPQSTWNTWGQWRLTNTSASAKRTVSSVSLYRPRQGIRLVPADPISRRKWWSKEWLTIFSHFFLQVYLCFQRVAAEILGVKLNKAEIEQSQVSQVFLSYFSKNFMHLPLIIPFKWLVCCKLGFCLVITQQLSLNS